MPAKTRVLVAACIVSFRFSVHTTLGRWRCEAGAAVPVFMQYNMCTMHSCCSPAGRSALQTDARDVADSTDNTDIHILCVSVMCACILCCLKCVVCNERIQNVTTGCRVTAEPAECLQNVCRIFALCRMACRVAADRLQSGCRAALQPLWSALVRVTSGFRT